jgi:hypothetical protein
MAQVASQQKMCGDFLSSLLHHGQKFVRMSAGKRSRPGLPHIFDHYLFSTLEVYEWPAMYCAAARAKNRSLISVATKVIAPKGKGW